MGCCDSCLKPSQAEYEALPQDENKSNGIAMSQATPYQAQDAGQTASVFHDHASKNETEKLANEFDPTLTIFEGMEMEQKFTNKSSYDTRFIWVSLDARTIHMSQHMTKDRRHKEASLADVTSVVAGPPTKAKNMNDSMESNCLTINFKRGGGIDLMLKSETERDNWYSVLTKIVLANENPISPLPN